MFCCTARIAAIHDRESILPRLKVTKYNAKTSWLQNCRQFRDRQTLGFGEDGETVELIMEIFVSPVSQNCAFAAAGVLALIAVSASALDNEADELAVEADELAVLRSPEYSAVEHADWAANAAVYSHKQADWGKVLNAAKALVAKYPSSGVAHAKLGDVYKTIGSPDEAVEAYRRAVKLNPDQPLAWESLGLIYKEKDKATQSDFAFSQAIAYEQKTVESQRSEDSKSPIGNMPLCTLGHIYHSAGKDEAAKGCFLQAMQGDPKSLAALMSSGLLRDIYLSEGNEKAAFDLTYQMMLDPKRRLHGAPPEAEAWADLAYWYSKHGQKADQLRCYEKAENLGLGR
jgi:tetratricopeptide (TPR) repeat protein